MIYRPELRDFQIRENCLKKQIVVRLALFMTGNTKNPQIEHCLCPKYGVIYRPDLDNLQDRKNI